MEHLLFALSVTLDLSVFGIKNVKLITDFAKYVGPTVKSDRNLTGPIKPMLISRTKCPPLSRTEYPCLLMSVQGFLVLVL